jgi:ribose 5-phosphate isomerase A
MTPPADSPGSHAEFKKLAAEHAVTFIKSGMIVGLGHGSTAAYAVSRIAELIRQGTLQRIVGIPCSKQTEADARRAGIQIGTLEEHPDIDLVVDGADEVDSYLNMIKGGGGALLREKVVAQASRRRVYIVDESKLSPKLGTLRAVPVEVVRFAWPPVLQRLSSLHANPALRPGSDGTPFLTDQGNVILDCRTGPLTNPEELAAALKSHAGVVEHGLFLDLATDVIVAGPTGIKHLTR